MEFVDLNTKNSIVVIFVAIMLFSCKNDVSEVRDLLKDKNRPIGMSKNMVYVYKDSGKVVTVLKTPLLLDFSNRVEHPYNVFPKGIDIMLFNRNTNDSTSVKGKYAIVYKSTGIAEIVGRVKIRNFAKNTLLETNQLYWDQKKEYLFTEEGFRLTTPRGAVNGFGFESKQDLTSWLAKDLTSDSLVVNEKR